MSSKPSPSGWKQGNVLREGKRAIIVLSVLLVIILAGIAWKELVVTHYATAFSTSPYLNEVNGLLMIMGILATTCFVLISMIIFILVKMQLIQKKLSNFEPKEDEADPT